VAEYWIVDPERREVTVVRGNAPDDVVTDTLRWSPHEATDSLDVDLTEIFGQR
jgi:Uma2 family endonuclease